MTSLQETLAGLIERRLGSIARAPQMWGSLESIEMQALQLIEIFAVLHDQTYASSKSRVIKESYRAFLRARYGTSLPAYLAQELDGKDSAEASSELARILSQFYRETESKLKSQVKQADITLELCLREDLQSIAQPIIASYYSALPRTVRRFQYPERLSSRGRIAKTDQLEFVADSGTGIEIRPPNGTPGTVLMAINVSNPQMDQKHNSLSMLVTEKYQKFAEFIDLVNTKADAALTVQKLDTIYKNADISHHMALAVVAMAPTSAQGIDKVVWGGKLLQRASCYVDVDTADRLMPVVRADPTKKEFDGVGVVRTADLDKRKYRMHGQNSKLTFVLTNEVLQNDAGAAVAILGETVRARGFSVRGEIFVTQIEILPRT